VPVHDTAQRDDCIDTCGQFVQTGGASLVVVLVASVVGFRIGARNRAESNDSGIPIEGANIWAQPLRCEQIDRYLLSYRGGQDGEHKPRAVTVIAAESEASIDRRAA
jgi:hypothetical protein